MIQDYIVDLNEFEHEGEAGNGSYGVIYKYRKKGTNEVFAIKKFLYPITIIDHLKSFLTEIVTLAKAKNPAVLSIYKFSLFDKCNEPYPTIITKFYPKRSLDIVLGSQDLSSTKRYIIILGIAIGMKYLHSKNIIHRDLNPRNILIDDNYYPLISDFGQSKLFDEIEPKEDIFMKTNTGTGPYKAPEIISGNLYSYKADVYSFSLLGHLKDYHHIF